jgi:integrase
MSKQARPWFRNGTGWWMVTVGGRQHKLVEGRENRKLAWQLYHELMVNVAESPESPDLRVISLCDYFLDWSEKNQSPRTYQGYQWFLQSFCDSCGDVRVADLKPYYVTQWIDSQSTWKSSETRYNGMRNVKRVFSWSVEQQLIGKSPVAGMKLPRRQPRRTYMKDRIYRQLRREACQPLKYLLFALRQTGARPSELYKLTWDEVQDDRFVLHEHKTVHKTGRARVIMLSQLMQRLVASLRKQATSEYVFVNTKGKPWNSNSVQLSLNRLRKKLGIEEPVQAYGLRHAFAAYALRSGVNTATVAELMGHVDTTMVSRVYGHLAQAVDHLLDTVDGLSRRCRRSKRDR